MTSQNPFLRPTRRWPWIVTAVIAVAVAAVAIVIAVSAGDGKRTGAIDQPTGETSDSGAPSTDELADPLAVISGSTTEKGVSVGYPQNVVGAVSAAVEYTTDLTSTLDPDRAEEVAKLVVDPDVTDPAKFRDTALNNRKSLGITPTGTVPEGAGLSVAPVGYQVLEQAETNVNLLLLCYVTVNRPDSDEEQRIGVSPTAMSWRDGDWKLGALDDGNDYDDLSIPLDDPQAKAKGWKALTR